MELKSVYYFSLQLISNTTIMNKKFSKNIILIAILAIAISGCKHETESFDGPSLVDRFGPFSGLAELEASLNVVDFAAEETVFFTAEFNKNVDWVLEITGMESGSVKRFTGFDSSLTEANTLWNGGTTQLPLFKDEMCSVVLTIPEEPSYIGTVEVQAVSKRNYANEGALFTDFETPLGPDLFVGNFEFEFTPQTGQQSDIPAEGNTYFRLEGTDNVVPNFFVGLVDISAKVTGNTYVELPTNVPEDLFFNCFMYSDGGPHGLAIVDFIFDSNGNGTYEDNVDANFRVEDYDLATWDGWIQISHPMSETGISQEQLESLVAIRLLLISDMNAQPDPPLQVEFGIDFMIFTTGAPLEL